MKIFIIGGSGSGKTYLAKKLANTYSLPHYDLDDVFWDNQAAHYGTKRNASERQAMLEEILHQEQWIIEGVYYSWCSQCFIDADRIYVLKVPRHTYRYRIIKRFIKRKFGLEKGKKETIRSLIALLKWTDSYNKHAMEEINQLLLPYQAKRIELHNTKLEGRYQ